MDINMKNVRLGKKDNWIVIAKKLKSADSIKKTKKQLFYFGKKDKEKANENERILIYSNVIQFYSYLRQLKTFLRKSKVFSKKNKGNL